MAATTTAPPNDDIKRLLPWLVAVAFFMQSLDTTILNTAVPAIAQAMGVMPLSVKAVLASYTLSLAVFIPISGWMADRFGTRRVFASAIGFFTLGSVLCGLSTSLEMLVACRVLQGVGGAMMMPVGRMTLGAHLRQGRSRPRHELRRSSQHGRPDDRAGRRRLDGHLSQLARRILRQRPGRPAGRLLRLSPPAGLPRARDPSARLHRAGAVRRRHCAPVLRAGSVRRSQPERARDAGPARDCNAAACRLRAPRGPDGVSAAQSRPVQDPHLPRRRERRLRRAPRAGRHPVPVPAALPDRPRLLAGPVGPAGPAAGGGVARHEGHHAGDPGAARLPHRAGRQHHRGRAVDHVVLDRGRRYRRSGRSSCRPSCSVSSRPCNTPA